MTTVTAPAPPVQSQGLDHGVLGAPPRGGDPPHRVQSAIGIEGHGKTRISIEILEDFLH